MSDLAYTVLIMLLTLAVLVAVHEYGHFWVARRCGVHVLRFSIGFGKVLARWRDRHGTEYALSAVPLGGYVKMLDEREGPVPPPLREQAFNRKPVLSRMAIVSAGPLANFLLALVAYWLLFLNGERGYAPVIGEVEAGSIAELAGLEAGQEIVAVDGAPTPTRQALSFRLLERIGDSGPIRFAVKYPDSDVVYESSARLDEWLAGEETPDLYTGLGLALYSPPVRPLLSEVMPGSPAERAGLKSGDLILATDGLSMPLWEDWAAYVRERPGETLQITVERDGVDVSMEITPEAAVDDGGERIGRVGVAVRLPSLPESQLREFRRGPVEAAVAAGARTGDMVVFTLRSLVKMVQGLISPRNLSGPITIAKVASSSAKSGLESYISFLALLSVSLGVLNLLPIPVLDGGHLLFYSVELVMRRPVPERIQALGYQVGLVFVISLMAFALYNDLTRLS
jgi:regulator of sigma E protease